MGEQNNIKKDSTFDFCDKEFKSFKEDVLCSQDDLHKSMQDNSVGFVIFYVVAIIFVAALFQLSTKDFSKKVRKINNLFIVLLVLLFSHNILIFLMYMISEIFDLKGRFISKVLRKKKNCLLFILIFSIVYILSSTLVLNFYDIKKIQILNFLFSFIIIFEICLKISQSERFILWIGENLDKSFRLFIMFIIGLNCTYFYTRLTLQIIESY